MSARIERSSCVRQPFQVLGCLAAMAFLEPAASAAVRPSVQGAPRLAAAAPVHLYVAGGQFGTPGVYRFQVKKGLPATTPDGVLTGGLNSPLSVGFDGAGYLYVSDGGVKIYNPGATGNAQPIRVITSAQNLEWLAVSKVGYVFVTVNFTSIYIYPPGANGPTPPLHVITPNSYIMDLVVDSNGRLYANGQVGPVFVYDDPIHHWQSPDRVITAQGGNEGYMRFPIALDEARNRLYLTLSATNAPHQWQLGDHAARDLTLGSARPDAISLTKDCIGNSFDPGVEYGIAEDLEYLMFSCLDLQAVLVYHNAPGRQRLVEAIHPPGLTNPDGMIFGP